MSPSIRRYLRYFYRFRAPFALFVVFSVLQVMAAAPVPFVVRYVFDTAIAERRSGALVGLGALMIALQVASSAFGLLAARWILGISAAVVLRLRESVFDKLYELPIKYHETTPIGEIHDRVVHETERVDFMTRNGVAVVVPSAVFATGILFVLIFINAELLLITIAFLPIVWLVNRSTRNVLRIASRRMHAAVETFSATTFGSLRTMRQTKILGVETEMRRDEDDMLGATADAGRHQGMIRQVHAEANRVVLAAWVILVLIVGGARVIDGGLTLGELFSFYAGLALIRSPLNQITGALPNLVAGRLALDSVFTLLDNDEPNPYEGERRVDMRGHLVVTEASFGYTDEAAVLTSVSLEVRPGEVIALMGSNGSGKTTLANLVLGFYRPNDGLLTMDGVEYDEIDMRHLRRQFGVLTQNPILMPGTVRQNISAGRTGVTEEAIRDALGLVSNREFLEGLDHGLDTKAFENGPLMSGGQLQRIALARALVGRPRVLILDEPTNHLDAEGLETLLDTLRNVSDAPAVLLITHEQRVAQLADRVYHLANGHLTDPPGRLVERD